ncbi:transcription factor bHLH110-like isoform X2 [Punica granatum]|uniref:Transcription factor bHLH110-like isoform X2 n=1 Tax=Punica granatum TaxID=22663 RepID=A0A6P8CAH7_PUNGR|nr:transcription factor bHLH110-like isoform X2 [Punica granatum]
MLGCFISRAHLCVIRKKILSTDLSFTIIRIHFLSNIIDHHQSSSIIIMDENINSPYDHLQDQLFIGSSANSSSSSPAPNSTFMSSNDYRFSSPSEATSKENDSSSSTNYTAPKEAFHPLMAQNLGFQLADLSNVSDNFPRMFADMLVNGDSASAIGEDLYLRPLSNHTTVKNNDLSAELSEKLMLKTLSSSSRIGGGLHRFIIPGDDEFRFSSSSRGLTTNFSQIHPSINISNPSYHSSCPKTSSFNCRNNWPTFDLLSNGRICENDAKTSGASDFGSLLQESTFIPDFGLHHMKQACRRETTSFERMSSFSPNTMEAKRPNSSINEPKASQVAPKKTRLESQSTSCPHMKVRKEKLGDRIAALQQLVAPFGKTDTASVLMEAIGYIKFLENQTLSVPYMKSSRNNNGTSDRESRNEDAYDNEEPRQDLRSRGLCLVPLSCMSYITNDGGGGGSIWPSQDFGGGI